jgi:mannose-6-phosphate isomerase-like protein (cupin superfamily)
MPPTGGCFVFLTPKYENNHGGPGRVIAIVLQPRNFQRWSGPGERCGGSPGPEEAVMATTMTSLLGAGKLHTRLDEIKRTKGAPPWVDKLVVNDQIVGTLICQPPGHPNDRHYHLVDEWWLVVEGEIDWEIEGQADPVHARAGDVVFAPANHFHHIRPRGTVPTIRLAITPPGEFHRLAREAGRGPYDA